jgi:hypothetical protein
MIVFVMLLLFGQIVLRGVMPVCANSVISHVYISFPRRAFGGLQLVVCGDFFQVSFQRGSFSVLMTITPQQYI